MQIIKYMWIAMVGVFIGGSLHAQRNNIIQLKDTTHPQTLTIISSFKPTLRPLHKIDISNALAVNSKEVSPLVYDIPQLHLFFNFLPHPIQALAMVYDSNHVFGPDNYIKLGYGNYNTAYGEIGLTIRNTTKSLISAYATHISSIGSLPFQQFLYTHAQSNGSFHVGKRFQLDARLTYDNQVQYLYGFPSSQPENRSSLYQAFNTYGVSVGLRNIIPNKARIDYSPSISYIYFTNNRAISESHIFFDYPFDIFISPVKNLIFTFNRNLDYSFYKAPGVYIQNSLIKLSPQIKYADKKFSFTVGPNFELNNSRLFLFPYIYTSVNLYKDYAILRGGWIGNFQKNDYQTLATQNPWIAAPNLLNNTSSTEVYIGLNGNLSEYFSFSTKVSYLRYRNLPIFVNSETDSKYFNVLYIPNLQAVRLHGELSYVLQDKFNASVGLNFIDYLVYSNNYQPWGLLPVEVTGTARWKLWKDLYLKSDLFFWYGEKYRVPTTLKTATLNPALDFNIGGEYQILKWMGIWVQLNNIFNNTYQRWNQYPVLGFNVVGGLKFNIIKK